MFTKKHQFDSTEAARQDLPEAGRPLAYIEYSIEVLEMHNDAVEPGSRVLIVDDLLATGGTASAAAELIKKLNGSVAGYAFLIELASLGGRSKLQGKICSLMSY